jgi:hypothetical protein
MAGAQRWALAPTASLQARTKSDVGLPQGALARLGQVSHVPRGFPHDFLAGADYTLGGMSARLDLPPGRTRYG